MFFPPFPQGLAQRKKACLQPKTRPANPYLRLLRHKLPCNGKKRYETAFPYPTHGVIRLCRCSSIAHPLKKCKFCAGKNGATIRTQKAKPPCPRRSCSYRGTRTSRAALALAGRAALGKARKSRRTDVRRLCLFVALSTFPLNAECAARQRFYSALVYVRRRLTISRSNTSHCACTARLVTSSGLDSTCSI